jgi:hypothetical protein
MRYPVLWLLGACFAAPAQALRCGGDIVSEGDSTFALTRRCGPPTAVEHIAAQVVTEGSYDPYTRRYSYEYVVAPHDLWFYNFGPARFVARITVRNGKIVRIDQEGYGD